MQFRVRTSFETELTPEGVVRALTDFSTGRPQTWPNIDPAKYRVHEVRETAAVVTEGNRRPNIWARERYDWSQPGTVRWTVEQSNFCEPGGFVLATIARRPAGGSNVTVDWQRTPTSPTGYLVAAMVRLFPTRILARDMKKTLDSLAHRQTEAEVPAAARTAPLASDGSPVPDAPRAAEESRAGDAPVRPSEQARDEEGKAA